MVEFCLKNMKMLGVGFFLRWRHANSVHVELAMYCILCSQMESPSEGCLEASLLFLYRAPMENMFKALALSS